MKSELFNIWLQPLENTNMYITIHVFFFSVRFPNAFLRLSLRLLRASDLRSGPRPLLAAGTPSDPLPRDSRAMAQPGTGLWGRWVKIHRDAQKAIWLVA